VASVDLSKLRIERDASGAVPSHGRALRRAVVTGLVIAIAFAVAFVAYRRVAGAAAEVEQATVTLAYPYQAITVLKCDRLRGSAAQGIGRLQGHRAAGVARKAVA